MCIIIETKKPVKKPVRCPVCQSRLCDTTFDAAALVITNELNTISKEQDINIFIKCRKCNKEVAIAI